MMPFSKAPKKDINLYALLADPKKSKMKKGAFAGIIAIFAIVAMTGGYVGVKVYTITLESQAKMLERKAGDETLTEKIETANQATEDIVTLQIAGGVYKVVREEIDGGQFYCDDFSKELVEQILTCETYSFANTKTRVATVTGLIYTDGTLQIEGSTTTSKYASYFVTNLTKLGLFSEVTYPGYQYSEDTGEYLFTVTATFYVATEDATQEDATQEEAEESHVD